MGARTFVNDRVSFSFARNWRRGVDMPMLLVVIAQGGRAFYNLHHVESFSGSCSHVIA